MKFLEELETVLKNDDRFVSQDGQLLKPRWGCPQIVDT